MVSNLKKKVRLTDNFICLTENCMWPVLCLLLSDYKRSTVDLKRHTALAPTFTFEVKSSALLTDFITAANRDIIW